MKARRLATASIIAAAGGLIATLGGNAGTEAQAQERPVLSAIEATFQGGVLQSTLYEVKLAPPSQDVIWEWELEPPADDPNCKEFEVISRLDGRSSAEWRHGDGDGCRHTGTDHAGRITVFAEIGPFACTATITGTSTHTGPEPNPCFRRPSPPPPLPTATTPPVIVRSEKDEWRELAALSFAGSSTFSGLAIGCALVPSPDPVSKGLAGVGLVLSMGYFLYGMHALGKAEDPPDKNYKTLAKLTVPKLPTVRAGSGVTAAMAAAANAILANVARVSANDAAFITSLERAQGAYAAKDGTWDKRQSRAAAAFARVEAKLLDTQPALDAAMKRVVAKAGVLALTAADARRATTSVGRNGLPPSFTSLAARLGIPTARVKAHEKRVAALPAQAIAGPVAAKFATPTMTRAHRSAAALLRALAKRLDKR